ncbi:MAG: NAD(P)-dependent alcohol dehydrogenase [Marinobacter sp.]|uniref:NAD(P)-dependent alcohol dehydrogenase n=1 Tax=Marinobacter sp. TaxID=50741 RepID=UPI0032984C1E
MQVKAYAIQAEGQKLEPFTVERKEPGSEDVLIELMYCGICHSDLIIANNESGAAMYPVVPGHEMVGRVAEVGADVDLVKVGDLVGVGCIADSCRSCSPCEAGDEQYCESGFSLSFNAFDTSGEKTFGGYSSHYTVNQRYAVKIPDGMDPAAAAPLLCGGITVYTPLKRYGAGPGKKVGVLGLGGLGHLAIKISSAMGAHTVMLTSSPNKVADAQKLGADEVVLTSQEDDLKAHAGSFDMIINTISGEHDANSYLPLLARGGNMCFVGAPQTPLPIMISNLLMGDKLMSGSLIGGIPSTAEMLEFCAEHNITADIEMINMDEVNEAWDRIEKNDVKYRFVIDLASL